MAKSITLAENNGGALYTYTVTQTGVSDTLNGDITAAVTTITLNDSSSFAASGKVRIGEEIISYTGNSANQLTGCTRGIESSTAAAHVSTDPIYQVTTAWSSDLKSTAAFDYFANNADVGSCIYFAHFVFYTPDLSGLVVNVGTAIAATSITLKWEAPRGNTLNTWGDLPGLVDETNDFTATGERRIRWHAPTWWRTMNVNGITMYGYQPLWVRVRITAVTGLTEGGANQTSAVKNISDNIVCTGGTAGDPITMDNIYDANVTGSWNAIDKIAAGSDYSSYINIFQVYGFKIYVKSGCVFRSLNEMILFMPGHFDGDNNAGNVVQIGDELQAGLLGKNGSIVMIAGWGYSTSCWWNGVYQYKFYDSTLLMNCADVYSYGCNFDIVQSVWMKPSGNNGSVQFYGGGVVNIKNSNALILHNTYTAPAGYTWSYDNSYIYSAGPYRDTPGVLARELSSYAFQVEYGTKTILFDCNWTTIGFGYLGGAVAGQTADFYIHNSLALTVNDVNGNPVVGANVHIVDKNGNVPQKWTGTVHTGSLTNVTDLTTNANGLASTDLHRRHWWWAKDTGSYTDDIYTPFTVTISKVGYATKTIKYVMDQKRIDVVVLSPASISIDQEALV